MNNFTNLVSENFSLVFYFEFGSKFYKVIIWKMRELIEIIKEKMVPQKLCVLFHWTAIFIIRITCSLFCHIRVDNGCDWKYHNFGHPSAKLLKAKT